jgi:hypothetical protein
MARVNWDDLTQENDFSYSYNGVPFTGLATEYLPDGRILGEAPMVNGIIRGVVRDWYGNGQLRMETGQLGGGLHGISRDWYPDGKLKREARGEFGVAIASREWDPKGNLVSEFQLEPSDWRYKELMIKRRNYADDIAWKEWPGKSVWEIEMPSPYPLSLPEDSPPESPSGAPL